MILFELLAARRPFSGESEYLLYQKVLRLSYSFPDDFPSDDARDLITHLLVLSPSDRFGSAKKGGTIRIRQHPFFVGMQWTELETQKSPLFDEDNS